MSKGSVRVGVSGWRYEPWRGEFYPPGLVQRRELAFAARALSTIEINGTFYSLQRPTSFAEWHDDTPDDFVFSVKAPQFITHVRRLREVEGPIANFFASGVLRLNAKLGPILWQLPPNMRFDAPRLEYFLSLLPHSTEEALMVACEHEQMMAGRAWLEIDGVRPLRHALEVRHESFVDPAFIALLRRYRVAFVVADTAERWPEFDDLTADFVYLRLHGAVETYRSGYSEDEIGQWAQRIAAWRDGGAPASPRLISPEQPPKAASRDVFCYFDNTDKLHAPANAARLLGMLGLPHGMGEDGRFRPLED